MTHFDQPDDRTLDRSASPEATQDLSAFSAPARKARPFFRRPLVLAAAGVVVALTASGAVAATAHKTVELDVNGETQTLSTFAGSVEGVLDQAGVEVEARDEVTPSLDEAVSDGDEIVFREARTLEVSIDGKNETIWTTALTASEALGDLAASGRDASLVASRSDGGGRTALELPLVDAGPVVVVVDGGSKTVEVDGPTTVGDVLEGAGVVLGALDRVVLTLKDGTPTVTVNRIVHGERVENEAIAHGTREQADPGLYEGERRIAQVGRDGEIQRVLKTVTVDGKEVSAEVTKETTTAQPVEEVVAVGTKKRPAPAATSSSSAASGGAAPSGGVWASLARCESGGNPSVVSANGLYYGLYQFSVGTWQSVGGSGLPSQASPAEQTKRAQMLQARSGWGQWPHCAAKLGLL